MEKGVTIADTCTNELLHALSRLSCRVCIRIRRSFLWLGTDKWQIHAYRVTGKSSSYTCNNFVNIRQDDEGGRRGTFYKNGDEYVVNKQVVEYTKGDNKYCSVRDLRIDGRGKHEDKGN